MKQTKPNEEQTNKIELPKELIEVTNQSNNNKPETQTVTIYSEFLEELTKLYNSKANLSLELPTIKKKGAKKQILKYTFYFALQNLGLPKDKILSLLKKGKYI